MRLIVLEFIAVIAALVFLGMLGAIATHRSTAGSQGLRHHSAWSEYLWALVPWLMMAACVLPSVRRLLASD
jgi:heme/copper-type cytochrome/quinol oxidase subunit 2